MIAKQRLSATVDPELIEAAEEAVARGEAASVSAWVSDALRLKAEQDRSLRALSAFVTSYEARHGEISPDEMALAQRRAERRAVTVRGLTRTRRPPARRWP